MSHFPKFSKDFKIFTILIAWNSHCTLKIHTSPNLKNDSFNSNHYESDIVSIFFSAYITSLQLDLPICILLLAFISELSFSSLK